MSKVHIRIWPIEFTKWWCHGELAKVGFNEAVVDSNKSQMARYGGALEMAMERFNDSTDKEKGIPIRLSEAQAGVIRTRAAQHVQDWKAACEHDDLALMTAAGTALLADWADITATFPQRFAPTGNETSKP